MKHSNDDGVLPTNLLQAFQKNKLIQGKLIEQQRVYYVKLVREMQDLKLKEKLNKELLYTWRKENYVRQLKKKLQEYEKKRFGVRDAYYEYQARNLDCVMSGQQGLAIPPNEEQQRLNVNAKLNQFRQENPLHRTSSTIIRQSLTPSLEQIKREQEDNDARAVQETWKHIHAQSAYGLKRKTDRILPTIQRSMTIDEIKRNQPSKSDAIPLVPAMDTTSGDTQVVSDGKQRAAALPTIAIADKLLDEFQPVTLTSESLQRERRGDLVAMRSVRRPQKNPIDLNITFESRKRIYQINKRVLQHHICPRKCGLQFNSQFDRIEQVDLADDDVENFLNDLSDTHRQRYEDRHQADKTFV